MTLLVEGFSKVSSVVVILESLSHEKLAQVLCVELLNILAIGINLTCQKERVNPCQF